jgi:hypothetical protein
VVSGRSPEDTLNGSRNSAVVLGRADPNHSPPRYVFALKLKAVHMDAPYIPPVALVADKATEGSKSAVSLAAIFAGTAVAISISLVLLTLGAGLGFNSASAWSGYAISPGRFAAAAAVWIVVVQWLSAASGGYMTGRLRSRWVGTHTHEVFFRDTAHGFITWAVATAIVAIIVASAASSMLAGGFHAATTIASGSAQGASVAPYDAPYDVDALFRNPSLDANSPSNGSTDGRGEATRILANALSTGGIPDADRSYLATMIAARTGISQTDAQKRVDQVAARARQQAETARKAAARTSLLNALAMMIGAFVACAAAALGGHERDRHP